MNMIGTVQRDEVFESVDVGRCSCSRRDNVVTDILRNCRAGEVFEEMEDVYKRVGVAPAGVRNYMANLDGNAFRGENTSVVVAFTSLRVSQVRARISIVK